MWLAPPSSGTVIFTSGISFNAFSSRAFSFATVILSVIEPLRPVSRTAFTRRASFSVISQSSVPRLRWESCWENGVVRMTSPVSGLCIWTS